MKIQRDGPTEEVHLLASCPVGALAPPGNGCECTKMRLLLDGLQLVESQRRAGDQEKSRG